MHVWWAYCNRVGASIKCAKLMAERSKAETRHCGSIVSSALSAVVVLMVMVVVPRRRSLFASVVLLLL
ncbi:unnamed protein product [Toxocara canis]|uniref:Secreted protein n=1 Tax=Toxocara canis TaxID=6265 RepID=A0A183UTD1_TOXCA|nr:unnamed protein product [Toxocara canis]